MLGTLIKIGVQTVGTMVLDSYLRSTGVYRYASERASALVCEYTDHVWNEKSSCQGTNKAGDQVGIQHCLRCPATRELYIRKS